MFSAGAGSWAAAKRVAERHGTARLTLLFTDTLIEDEDAYRFLIEGAADVFGTKAPDNLLPKPSSFPPLSDKEGRRMFLSSLARDAMEAIPGLVWLIEGRDPFQVFRDERFLGNSHRDPCSKILKRQVADRWLDRNKDPKNTTVYVGIDWSEEHRFDDGKGGGVGPRHAKSGWNYQAPMCERPFLTKDDMLALLKDRGIAVPRLYKMGFAHNNCGGICIKAGHGHFMTLLREMPERYAHYESEEEAVRRIVGQDVSMMSDRTGDGKKKPLTMRRFREKAQAGGKVDLFDVGGCGCFLTDDAPAEAEMEAA